MGLTESSGETANHERVDQHLRNARVLGTVVAHERHQLRRLPRRHVGSLRVSTRGRCVGRRPYRVLRWRAHADPDRCRALRHGCAQPAVVRCSNSSHAGRRETRRLTPIMSATSGGTAARTQSVRGKSETYAYRRFGAGSARPLLFLQHFTGTLDNWDPAVTDSLTAGREVILFDSAGVGRSTGKVPPTVVG